MMFNMSVDIGYVPFAAHCQKTSQIFVSIFACISGLCFEHLSIAPAKLPQSLRQILNLSYIQFQTFKYLNVFFVMVLFLSSGIIPFLFLLVL